MARPLTEEEIRADERRYLARLHRRYADVNWEWMNLEERQYHAAVARTIDSTGRLEENAPAVAAWARSGAPEPVAHDRRELDVLRRIETGRDAGTPWRDDPDVVWSAAVAAGPTLDSILAEEAGR